MEVITDGGVGGVKGKVLGTQVGIKEDGEQLYPQNGHTKAKLHDDWSREWKFRSLYPGLGFVRPNEMWIPGTVPTDVPSHAGDATNILQTHVLGNGQLDTMHEIQVGDKRYPAVLTKQWQNGCFEVTAFKPNNFGLIEPVEFPTMHKSSIFLRSTGQSIDMPKCMAALSVPRSNPSNASVVIEGESFVKHLGRVSPKITGTHQAADDRRVVVDCPKPLDLTKRIQNNVVTNITGVVHQQEEHVKINVGAREFEHFLSGEVRAGDATCSRLHKSWTVELGPFAEHKIVLVKRSHLVPVLTLYVDGEILAECTSTDLGGSPNLWQCKFHFVGERLMDFIVHEETKDGVPLDSKAELTKPYEYRHVIEIAYAHRAVDNLAYASMTVDGIPFERLAMKIPENGENPVLTINRIALEAQFGLQIPRKIVAQDTRLTAHQIAQSVVDHAGGWSVLGGMASSKIQDAGQSLSQLGMTAWQMMSQQGQDSSLQTASTEPSSGQCLADGGMQSPKENNQGIVPAPPIRCESAEHKIPKGNNRQNCLACGFE
jgi:hypothetical protein